ncbi:hypothetical protein MMC07_008605 [Pseudocyphellaria aurata]|nr:hypothetical protein [Pseudocyphellaria aurata]
MEQTTSTQNDGRADHTRHGSEDPKSLVCEKCWNEVFDTDAYETICMEDDYAFKYTRSHHEIQTAALVGCNWCMFIMSELVKKRVAQTQVTVEFKGKNDPFRKSSTPVGRNTYHLYLRTAGHYWGIHLFAYAHAADAAAEFVTARKLQPDVSSDSAVKQCREWLSDCAWSHEQCRKPAASQLPTRVVDVSAGGSSDKPRILETRGKKGEYLTLSYCWGKQSVGLLNTQNQAAYYEQLDVTAISPTLRDAIDLTKRLGFRFIWIDALCIIQDCERDKEKELSCMRRTYQDSILTIVASSASGADEGFLADRSNEDLGILMNRHLVDQGVSVDQSDLSNPSSTYEIPFRYKSGCIGRMFFRTDYYAGDLLEPVNRRAWTLQEQLLTPRHLLYSSHTLQWRCRSRSRNLDDSLHVDMYQYAFMQPLAIDEHKASFNAEDEGDEQAKQQREAAIWKSWTDILHQYCIRQASLSDDKLVALGGAAEEFSRVLNGRYVAGLWDNLLCDQLLWECPGLRRSRPAQYRAPSWSWAAIDGPVMPARWSELHGGLKKGRKSKSQVAEVVECKIVLKSQMLPFGAVIDGFIKLRAARRPGRLFFEEDPSSNLDDHYKAFVIWEDNEMWQTDGRSLTSNNALAVRSARANLDALGHTSKEEVECLAVKEIDSGHDSNVDGLLLQRAEDGLYRRIGVFSGAKKAAFEHIEQEEVIII